MKLSLSLLTLLLLTSIIQAQQPKPLSNNTFSRPLSVDTGHCSFPETASISWVGDDSTDNPFFAFFKPLKGIPANWTHVRKTIIWMNGYQFFYQNYITGEISPELYKQLQQQMQWSPDESLMSKNHLDCYVYLVCGRDEKGQEWMPMVGY